MAGRVSAWVWFGATVVATFATYVLTGMNGAVVHGATAAWNGYGEVTSWALLMLTAAVLGVVVRLRRPDNVLGPVFLASGFVGALSMLGDAYAGYALVTAPGSLPGGVLARFVSFLSFAATWFLAGVAVPALFPTGHPVSRRWRFVIWLGALGAAGWGLIIFQPKAFRDDGLLGNVPAVRNPLEIPGASVIGEIGDLALLGLFAGMFGAIISMVVRAIRSHGVERQQIKIVAYTVAVVTVLQLVVANTLEYATFVGAQAVWNAASQIGIIAIPASIAIALLRYRLYDVDRLINRTLVYAVLSAMLALIYAGVVFAFGTITRPLTTESDLGIAVSVLVVAAVFAPLRRFVQRTIDRRFYRARYNAERTLERFTARLRAETDLTALRHEIEAVAAQTMHPERVGLWLAPETRSRRVLS